MRKYKEAGNISTYNKHFVYMSKNTVSVYESEKYQGQHEICVFMSPHNFTTIDLTVT